MTAFFPSLEERLRQVQMRIITACERAGRAPAEVTLIAVSKTKPADQISAAFDLGQLDFGENYVQEWQEKSKLLSALPSQGLRWHFIGHLQRNKCKYIAGKVACIHAVHSLALAQELERRTPEGQCQPLLLQLNIGQEPSKFGFSDPEELLPLLTPETPWQRIEIQGLMAIPPYTPDPEASRPYLQQLRHWRDQLQAETGVPLPHLSMGMSHDLEVAIEEGATYVRVGTAIFGSRR